MSQYEDDAAMVGDWLADLVEQGRISDADVFAYLAGDAVARKKVAAVLAE